MISTKSGRLCGRRDLGRRVDFGGFHLDDWVQEDKGCEEGRMVEGEFCSGWRWKKGKKGEEISFFFLILFFLVLLIYALGVLFLGG